MTISKHLAQHFNDVHFGGNWTSVNFKAVLSPITWEQAVQEHEGLNTIAKLVFHCNYYVEAVLKVLEGGVLEAHDSFSYDLKPIHSEKEWQVLKDKFFQDAEMFSALVAVLPDDKIWENMADSKYGTYYRNIQGIIEHCHYHLGQIVIINRMVQTKHK
jgi:hypothetical protein